MNLICALIVLIYFSVVASSLAQSKSSGSEDTLAFPDVTLPDLIVTRSNQMENVVYESDHSISLTKLDIETVQKVLASGDGVVVNFDLEFASETAVMTAEGKHVVDILLGAMKYVRTPTQYEVQLRDANGQSALSQARAQALMSSLSNRFSRHQFEFSGVVSKSSVRSAAGSPTGVDVWSFSIASMTFQKFD